MLSRLIRFFGVFAIVTGCFALAAEAGAQDFQVLGSRITRDADAPFADTSWSGTSTGWHLQVYLKNVSGASRTVTDFTINGKDFDSIEDVNPGRAGVTSTKWWILWPHTNIPNNAITVLRVRLPQGATTIGGGPGTTTNLGLTHSGGSDTLSITPHESTLWMPFVHVADNLQDITIYVGWRGAGSVTVTPATCLEINGVTVTAAAPAGATTLSTDDIVPLSVSLPSPLTLGENVIVHATASGEEAWGYMRAIDSSFSTTFFFYETKHDPNDVDSHFFTSTLDLPGSVRWEDEPYTFRPGQPAQNVAEDAMEDLAGNRVDAPMLMQLTDTREVQVYCGMADIFMTHDNSVRQQIELGLHHVWPRPTWYLPQIAWARTESNNDPLARESWYRVENFRRDALANLGRGAKGIQWFIHQNLWEQDAGKFGGSDLARERPDLFFYGALANPVLWDRIGRIAGLMRWAADWLDDSAPLERNLMGNDIEALTLVNPDATKATVVVTDYGATDLQDYYRTGIVHKDHDNLTTFTNLTVQAKIPGWVTADTAILLDPFNGAQAITMTDVGGGMREFTLPYFQEAAVIVLGSSADLSSLQSDWTSTYEPVFNTYGDPEGSKLYAAPADMKPAVWTYGLGAQEKSMDISIHPDGARVLVVRSKTARLLDADGNELWSKTYAGYAVDSCFSKNGDLIYIGADIDPEATQGKTLEPRVFAYDLDGVEQWVHDARFSRILDMQSPFTDNSVAYAGRDPWFNDSGYVRLSSADGSVIVDRITGTGPFGDAIHFPVDMACLADGHVLLHGTERGLNRNKFYNADGSVDYSYTPEDLAWQNAANMSADGSRFACAGTHLSIRDGSDGSEIALKYIGRHPRKIALSDDGSYVAAGTCDGNFAVFTGAGADLWSTKEVGAFVSDVQFLPAEAGIVVAYEKFMADQSAMWGFRDIIVAYNKDTGAELWRHEGRWRDQPFMTQIALSRTGNKLAVLAGQEARLIDYTAANTSNAAVIDPEASHYLPYPWENRDIGNLDYDGYCDYSIIEEAFFAVGSGLAYGAPSNSDEFNYTFRAVTGDFTFTARVPLIRTSASYDGAGIMLRETITGGSKTIGFWHRPRQNNIRYHYRETTGGGRQWGSPSQNTSHIWQRIVRSGDTYSLYLSQDGASWSSAGGATFDMADTIYLGFAVQTDSADAVGYGGGNVTMATFDHVEVSGNTAYAEYGLLTVDIEPAAAVAQGAQWTIDGGATWNNPGEAGYAQVGENTVVFKEFDWSWMPPFPVTVSLPRAGWEASTSGTYQLRPDAGAETWRNY